MKKRYDTKSPYHEVYNNFYCRYQNESSILNTGRNEIPSAHSIFYDRENIKIELLRRIGDQKGQYFKEGRQSTAYIPFVEMKLAEIEERFENHKRHRVNEGYIEPKEMPKELLKERLQFEARLDVLNGECDILQKKLKEYADIEEIESASHVLEYGLQGSGHFHGTKASDPDLINVLKEIDGQRITQTESGLLIINDKRSPYSGMSVADYRSLCNVYKEQLRAADKAKLKQLQIESKERGELVPEHLPFRTPHKVSLKSLPAWPEGVKNHLMYEEESSSLRKTN